MHHIPVRHTSGLIRTRSRVWAVWLPRPRGPGLHTETEPMRSQAAVAVPPDHHKCQESRTHHCLHDIVNLFGAPAAHHSEGRTSAPRKFANFCSDLATLPRLWEHAGVHHSRSRWRTDDKRQTRITPSQTFLLLRYTPFMESIILFSLCGGAFL